MQVEWLNFTQAAQFLKVSRPTLYKKLTAKELPEPVTIGRMRLFRLQWLQAYQSGERGGHDAH